MVQWLCHMLICWIRFADLKFLLNVSYIFFYFCMYDDLLDDPQNIKFLFLGVLVIFVSL